jgi:predicted Fe-Mo cluster-binding NifX family protein
MFVIFPSDNETGTLSPIAAEFETAAYYTIDVIIEDTLADTKIKTGFTEAPAAGNWGSILRKLKIEVVVANRILPGTLASIQDSGIRVIQGARGLVGDLIDWIAEGGVDEFAEKVRSLNPAAAGGNAGNKEESVDPLVNRAAAPQTTPAGAQNPSQGGREKAA